MNVGRQGDGERRARSPTSTRRASVVLGYQVLWTLLSLVTGIITARALGPHGRGAFAIAQIPSGLIGGIAIQGVAVAAIYQLSGEHETPPRVLRGIIALSTVGSALLVVLITALWFPLHTTALKGVSLPVLIVANLIVPAYTWTSVAQSYLFSAGKTAKSQAPQIAERLTTMAGLIIATATGASVMKMVAATTIGMYGSAVWTAMLIGRRNLGDALRARGLVTVLRGMLSYSSRLLVANVATRLTYRLDQIIVNIVAGPTTVGYYAVAARLAELPLLLPRSVREAWVAARSEEDNYESTEPVLIGARKLNLLMAVGVPSFAAVVAPLVPIMYGHNFTPAVKPLLVLLVATFVLSLSFPFVTALTGAGRPGKVAVVSWVSLPVTVGLDILLIPPFGAVGAAIASVAAYSTLTMAAYVQWRVGLAKGTKTTLLELVPRTRDARALLDPLRKRFPAPRPSR